MRIDKERFNVIKVAAQVAIDALFNGWQWDDAIYTGMAFAPVDAMFSEVSAVVEVMTR